MREVARGEGRGQQEEEKEQEAAPTKGVYPALANREANKRIPKLQALAGIHAKRLLLNCRARPSHERIAQTSQVASFVAAAASLLLTKIGT